MDFILALCAVGAIIAPIAVCYGIMICVAYAIYRATNGKKSFHEYIQYW